jgi:acetylornithine deacetylase/succinyl-diaminopimelate desuccinylase-like protein
VRSVLATLLATPSPQPDLAQVRAFVADTVRPLLSPAWDDVRLGAGGNLIARQRRARAATGEILLLLGYAGTYPPEGMAEAFSGASRRRDGREYLVGRGASEQMGALAALLLAANALAEAHTTPGEPARELVFAVSCAGETGSHEHVRYLVEDDGLRPRAAVLGLGTNNRVCLGNKGRVDVEIEVRGRACHSSIPTQGLNAIVGAQAVLERLAALDTGPPDPDLGAATLTPTAVESWPKASHTVPDRVRLVLDRRLLPGQEPDDAVAALRAAIGDLAPYEVTVKVGAYQYASKLAPDAELARCAVAALRAAGAPGETFYLPAALDGGYLSRLDAEALMLGPGDPAEAHTADEQVALDDVVLATEAYYRLGAAYLAGPASPAAELGA